MKLLTPIIFIGLSVALFFWYIYPQYQHIQVLRDTASQYSAAIDRARDDVKKRDDLLVRFKSFNPADLDRLQKFLPDNIRGIDFAVDVSNLVSRYGAAVKDIKIDDPAKVSGTVQDSRPYTSQGLTLSVAMPYDRFVQFVADIEKSLRYMDISSINFAASDASGITTYIVGLKTYALK